jgi:hypothetical protein
MVIFREIIRFSGEIREPQNNKTIHIELNYSNFSKKAIFCSFNCKIDFVVISRLDDS